MNKNLYKYYIIKDKHLIVEIIKGSFNLSEFVNLKKRESKDPEFNPDFNTLLDIRDIDNVFTKKIQRDLQKFSSVIKTIQDIPQSRKTAVITCTPVQVTGITWYMLIDDRGIEYKVFSTLEYAIKWLGINELDLKDIEIYKPEGKNIIHLI